uniref:Uncharacterized protein n=1 Tax=Rhizophora mucronata TaxID=61149 RepID=A0A2P2J0U6_RHIMU
MKPTLSLPPDATYDGTPSKSYGH